ncbi:tripartite tricarboxylate transporter TctB family protein [Meridianimarinicoccus roseus]|uniref:Tripartite tricarboxylate transporter TctB family protein n=1 Tax=Meridianimarinicoccus roseus TaxID=2072018 RepID=A0A2V2LE43_9RHOB|nr:tripartite tricarboxylate transporter TctB family protein [Meridianimarinicoccus roseus]PWR03818.1 tripartite tricarboxylate transporter TctB family protein [Meridianimarinicoccus roseus]
MLTADRVIAAALMVLSAYFMWHATALPIGWNGMTGGPGGGAFPFWLSAIMFVTAGAIIVRSFRIKFDNPDTFFDQETLRAVLVVIGSLVVTITLMPWAGAYIALPLFLLWYLKVFGKHGWTLTLLLTLGTPVFLFFFFEVTLKILLPKGFTEPLFIPLYARFF